MKITVEENTTRIDKYLTSYLDESRSSIDKMIEAGFIKVNGNLVNTHYVPKTGDEITVEGGFKEDIDIKPEKMDLDIIYEDDDVLVINKPSGLVVHPGAGNTNGTLVNGLMAHTEELSDINGEVRLGIVHRIDKDTTGLMIVAKNNKAHEILSDALSRHEIKRDYLAIIKGEFPSDTATIDAPIGRDEVNRKKMAVTSKNSKEAITHLRVVKRFKGFTLVRLSLETGRTHQIRVHMAYIGHPIYNDPVYGKSKKTTKFGQFLHSKTIHFIHPITKKVIDCESPLPKEFQDYLDTLDSDI